MLSIINEKTNTLIAYIKDDPVRPEISADFRVSGKRFISALVDGTPRAIVCVSLHDFVPSMVEELDKDTENPDIAIFYTIWSYAPGAGVELLRETVNTIRRQNPKITRFVTLSPKTEMARKFHLRNGAIIMRENEKTVNYEYIID